ncbi:hypothetical protein MN116_005066 [Schistosoma mekongi]|uniref:Uncharacterized protein n=1 Tax=Schistosoma mekongi TaxID=38744 RepID=A0AAE1ZDW6_SCHME|nr:hypothetical protein MN116_005066 [Schistosoma mekongi]
MRWLFSKRSGSKRALVENKLKIKKRPLIWSLFCTAKRSSLTAKHSFRENIDNQKSRRVQQRRKSRIYNDLDTNRLSSFMSLSSESEMSTEMLTDSNVKYCNYELPIAFCPTCHTNVVPVYEQKAIYSNHATVNGILSRNKLVEEVSKENTVYESVYKNSFLSIDTTMDYELAECANVQPIDMLQLPSYFIPAEPLAFSTIDRRAVVSDDCKTIYDEVASDNEEYSPSGYYDSLQFVMLKRNNRPYRKRSAYPESDSYQEMKRMRREVFVCEE